MYNLCMEIHIVYLLYRVMLNYYISVEITNKMQPCNRIYYSKVY